MDTIVNYFACSNAILNIVFLHYMMQKHNKIRYEMFDTIHVFVYDNSTHGGVEAKWVRKK